MSTQDLGSGIEVQFLCVGAEISNDDSANATGGNAFGWVSMANHHKVVFAIGLGGKAGPGSSWYSTDDVATITVQQATSSAGAGLKAVAGRTHAITEGVLDAQNDVAYVAVAAEELDVDGGFTHVRVKVAVTDNGGTDHCNIAAILYQPRFSQISRDRIEYNVPDDGFGT